MNNHFTSRISTRSVAMMMVAILLAPMVLLMTARAASAHRPDEAYLYFELFEDGIEGRVEYKVSDLNEVFGLGLVDDDTVVDQFAPHRDSIIAYTQEHLTIGDAGTPWGVEFGEVEALTVDGQNYIQLNFDVVGEPDPVPRAFDVQFDPLVDDLDNFKNFVVIQTDWGSGTFNNEGDALPFFFDADNRSERVDLDDASWIKGITGTIGLGAEHIQIGTDHIFFILVLLLPSVLVWRSPSIGWEPAPRFTSSLWRVFKIATFFTIAHSITLTLGGLGFIDLPGRFVEAVIAASIGIAALHNLRPVAANKEWMLAFAFGLFHGFGFAGLLGDLGLERNERIWSLLGFNIGVELGQLAIIILLFPALFLLRRTRFYDVVLKGGSILLAIIAFGWTLERALDTDLKVDTLVDPVVQFPRVLGLVAVLTVAAAALYWNARSRSSLRPLPSGIEELDDAEAAAVVAETVGV